jgi:hypothetical protein
VGGTWRVMGVVCCQCCVCSECDWWLLRGNEPIAPAHIVKLQKSAGGRGGGVVGLLLVVRCLANKLAGWLLCLHPPGINTSASASALLVATVMSSCRLARMSTSWEYSHRRVSVATCTAQHDTAHHRTAQPLGVGLHTHAALCRQVS